MVPIARRTASWLGLAKPRARSPRPTSRQQVWLKHGPKCPIQLATIAEFGSPEIGPKGSQTGSGPTQVRAPQVKAAAAAGQVPCTTIAEANFREMHSAVVRCLPSSLSASSRTCCVCSPFTLGIERGEHRCGRTGRTARSHLPNCKSLGCAPLVG